MSEAAEPIAADDDPEPIVIKIFGFTLGELMLFEEKAGHSLLGIDWAKAGAAEMQHLLWLQLRRTHPTLSAEELRDYEIGRVILDFTRTPRAQRALAETNKRERAALHAAVASLRETPAEPSG